MIIEPGLHPIHSRAVRVVRTLFIMWLCEQINEPHWLWHLIIIFSASWRTAERPPCFPPVPPRRHGWLSLSIVAAIVMALSRYHLFERAYRKIPVQFANAWWDATCSEALPRICRSRCHVRRHVSPYSLVASDVPQFSLRLRSRWPQQFANMFRPHDWRYICCMLCSSSFSLFSTPSLQRKMTRKHEKQGGSLREFVRDRHG